MPEELERPPSLWPWIIGIVVGLIVIGAVVGSIVHALFQLFVFLAILAVIAWGVMRLVRGSRRP